MISVLSILGSASQSTSVMAKSSAGQATPLSTATEEESVPAGHTKKRVSFSLVFSSLALAIKIFLSS